MPEKYTLQLPEGSPLDQSDIDAIAAMGKAKKWTQEQATAALQEMHTAQVEQGQQLLSTLTAHPEVGGANLEAAQRDANAVLDRFLPGDKAEGQELRSVLKKSGYGNYAPLVVLLSRIGKAMREDKGLGAPNGGQPVSREAKDVLYGGTPVGSGV